MDYLYTTLAAVAGALVGAYTGFLLNEVLRERRSRRKSAWVADVIRREIQYNLDALDKSRNYLPTRSTQIWDKQLPNVLGAFDQETFARIHKFYLDLHDIYKSADENRKMNLTTRDLIVALKNEGNPL